MTEQHPNYIAGEWVPSDEEIVDVNPSDVDEVVGKFARASRSDVQRAIESARDAAPAARALTPQQRSDMLNAAARELSDRVDELATLIAREQGKTFHEAVGEAKRAAGIFSYFAGEALRLGGDLGPSVRPNIRVEVAREPIGVVGLITPWNVPLAIPSWKAAPALAFGNCVVLKPAELTPAVAWELTAILDRAGVPAGMFNLVMGSGSVVGDEMVNHPDIDAISFTGSDATGRNIATATAARLAKVQLEMGGKNPLVVLDDADLDVAVNCALDGAFFWSGQRCTASSRIIVTEGIADAFTDALVERTEQLRVDHALAEGVDIGPVVDERQLRTCLDYIDIGKNEGAELACGGQTLEREKRGHYFAPTVFVSTTNEMRINREEIFGPIASIIRVSDLDHAIEVANDTPFGLSSGIATTSLSSAHEFQRRSAAGMVMVNLPTAGVDYHVPFGGNKGSSFGPREQGPVAMEFYTTLKTSYVAS